MAGRERLALALVAVALAAAVAAGCGGGDDSTTAAGDAGAAAQAKPPKDAGSQGSSGSKGSPGSDAKPKGEEPGGGSGSGGSGGGSGGSGGSGDSGSGSEEPSKEFITPGGDNSVQTFGEEASDDERAAASAALEAFMAARASGDWQKACVYISKPTIEPVEKLLAPVQGCVDSMTAVAKRLPPSALANSMTGPIASFRVEGDRGFALYHGKGGIDYTMPMSKAGGWQVASLEPTELP